MGRLFIWGALAVAVVFTAALIKFYPGKKRPIAYGMCGLGFLLILPMMLTEAWGVIDPRTIPESISVPAFLSGGALFAIGLLTAGILFKRGVQ
ncbi:MAG TPA: hypothetical protein VG269_18340 [Tepidisphaeraceae bacterium]|nr:hypothetical protein [Tepidisphaeraceae bacterium]